MSQDYCAENAAGKSWIVRLHEGDDSALNCAYVRYARLIYKIAERIVKDSQTAEDIVSETFIKLWKLHANMTGEEKVKAFLITAARNHAIDEYHKKATKAAAIPDIKAILYSDEDTGILEAEYAALMEKLKRLIEALPVTRREKVDLLFFQDKTTEQIAEILNINPQSVLNLKARIIQGLRNGMTPTQFIFFLAWLDLIEKKLPNC